MPWGDWQFWVVTLAAGFGVVAIVRVLWPKRKKNVRTTLTVGGQSPRKRKR